MWLAGSLESHGIFSKETNFLSIFRPFWKPLVIRPSVYCSSFQWYPNQNLQLLKPVFQDHPLLSQGVMQEEQDVISRGEANSAGTHTHDMYAWKNN